MPIFLVPFPKLSLCLRGVTIEAFCGYPRIFQRFLLWDHHSMLPSLPLRQAARPFPIEQDDSGHCDRSGQLESVRE